MLPSVQHLGLIGKHAFSLSDTRLFSSPYPMLSNEKKENLEQVITLSVRKSHEVLTHAFETPLNFISLAIYSQKEKSEKRPYNTGIIPLRDCL